jgi:hypothetical protein
MLFVNNERFVIKDGLIRIISYIVLFVAIFSGRFSIGRIIDLGNISYLLELRLLAIVAAYVTYLVGIKRGIFVVPFVTKKILVIISLLSIFYIYAVCNIAGWGNRDLVTGFILDAFVVLATLFLITRIIVSREDLAGFLRISAIIGVVFVVMVLFGIGETNNYGPGWALFDGKITFYRIEYFSFCAAMFLAARSENKWTKLSHYVLACICLYAAMATLSKASLIGVFVAFSFMWFYWLVISNYKSIIMLTVITLVTGSVYYYANGDKMYMRFAKGFSVDRGVDAISNSGVDLITGLEKSLNQENASIEDGIRLKIGIGLNKDQIRLLNDSIISRFSDTTTFSDYPAEDQIRMIALWEIFRESGVPDYRNDFSEYLRWMSSLAIVVDGSSRLRMAQSALSDFKQNILYGSGVYNYTYWSLNSSATGTEVYKYPHNIVLEVAASMGLVGLILFGGAIISSMVFITKELINYPNAIYLITYLVFFMVTSLFSGDLYDFRIFWIGVLFILTKDDRIEESEIKVTHANVG